MPKKEHLYSKMYVDSATCCRRTFPCETINKPLRYVCLVAELIQIQLPIAQNPCLTLVALSVHLLLQWMKLKFNAHRPTQLQSLGLPCNIFEWFPLSAKVMIERLCSQGWCPYRVLNTCSNLSSVTLYYLSSMPLQGATRGNHNKCTTEKCVATTKSQDVSHRKVNCTCSIRSEIKPDMERVKTLVESGEIPLVEAEKNSDNGEIEIRVVKATPYTRYTAISHVVSFPPVETSMEFQATLFARSYSILHCIPHAGVG